MIKKIIFFAIIALAIATVLFITYSYFNSTSKENIKKPVINIESHKPSSYCLISYDVSTDNGKSWHHFLINNGEKPMYKAECWKKYIYILDKFSASTSEEGKWYNKNKKGKIISNPSLHFSDKPFQKEPEEQTNNSSQVKPKASS